MRFSPSTSFRLFYNSSLQDYTAQTGTNLVDQPVAKKLEKCESADSICSLLQENIPTSQNFREDGKVIKPLECAVHVFHTLFTGAILGEGVGPVCPMAFIPISYR